jgi:hypothetical protein
MGTQIFQKSRSHLTIAGARRMTGSEFQTEDPQTLGATVKNLVSKEIFSTGFVDF